MVQHVTFGVIIYCSDKSYLLAPHAQNFLDALTINAMRSFLQIHEENDWEGVSMVGTGQSKL